VEENVESINQFYEFMNHKGSSERHIVNNLKVILNFNNFFQPPKSITEVTKEDILNFLNSKVKSSEEDPDKKWITTWNHYMNHIKFYYRYLHNVQLNKSNAPEDFSEWKTPDLVRIKMKRTKRLSPYSQNEIWEREELLTIINYEPSRRNKAALALFWDLDARNHEVTLLKLKNIRLKEKYGEGEVPHEAKTGAGPILLTLSFPYVRDWLDEHPFRREMEARLICNSVTGGPIKPDAMWTMMKQLKTRISRMVEKGEIKNVEEKEKLEYLLVTKKWNPYCLRHSSISWDSDYLPEYALKKKVRWSMNSRQGTRYIKKRMGTELKNKILEHNGIVTPSILNNKPVISECARCRFINSFDSLYCKSCSYPLKPEAYDSIKQSEDNRLRELEYKYTEEMNSLRREMELKFQEVITKIDLSRITSLNN